MAIWRGTEGLPSVGPGFHLKYKAFSGGDQWAEGAANTVSHARIVMRYVLTALGDGWASLSDDQKAVGDYYFQLGGAEPVGNEFDVIQETLRLTSIGLSRGGLNLKVTVEAEDNGYVGMHDSRFSMMDKIRSKTGGKARWTPGVDPQARRGPRRTKLGDIHIDSDAIDRGVGFSAMVLIHEATHKFASTGDYVYVDEDTGQYEAPITKGRAMNNADSYAYFVVGAFQERPT